MASRKDKKGRVLRKGESYRESDEMYVYAYTDSLSVRRYAYSKSLLKLREKEKQILKDQLDGIDTHQAARIDLNHMFDLYMKTKHDLRDSTRQYYYDTYDRYIRKNFGRRKIANIKHTDILSFYSGLMTEKKLHISTIKYMQRLIRPTLELAVRDNLIRNNPADGVIKMLSRKNIKECTIRHALTIEQQRAFLSYVDLNPTYERWYPLLVFMFGTGCRIGEIVGLRWEDVDLKRRIISINHSVMYMAKRNDGETTGWLLNDPKTEAGVRIIPMVEPVYEVLRNEKNRQETMCDSCVTEISGMRNFIFFNRFNEVYIPQGINKEIKRMVSSYNKCEMVKSELEGREPEILPYFTCHYVRHTFCSRLCEADMNIKAIQSVMGHKDIQTTLDIYAEVSDRKKKESLEKVFKEMKLF